MCKKGRVKKGAMLKVLASRPIFQKRPLTIGRHVKSTSFAPYFPETATTIGWSNGNQGSAIVSSGVRIQGYGLLCILSGHKTGTD